MCSIANRYELSDEDWEGTKEYSWFSRWEDPQSGGINYAERDPLVCSGTVQTEGYSWSLSTESKCNIAVSVSGVIMELRSCVSYAACGCGRI